MIELMQNEFPAIIYKNSDKQIQFILNVLKTIFKNINSYDINKLDNKSIINSKLLILINITDFDITDFENSPYVFALNKIKFFKQYFNFNKSGCKGEQFFIKYH